jgi:hypothetical protein
MSTNKKSAIPKGLQGPEKVKIYFLDLIDRKDFLTEVKRLREKYGIPEEGFKKRERHITPVPPIYGPSYPKRWDKLTKEPIDQAFWLDLFKDENKLAEKFQLPPNNLNIIDDYVLYNDTAFIESDVPNLFMIQDCHDLGRHKTIDKEINTGLPILLRISPYASQRDLLDYIGAIFESEVRPIQEKYMDKTSLLGKLKTRRMRERNKLVYENKHLPPTELRTFLREKGVILGPGEIEKILSLERIRRKEV